MEDFAIPPMTNEEVETLDAAAAQRKMGELDAVLCRIQSCLLESTETFNKAKTDLMKAKYAKEIIVERMRNLKNFIRNG